MIKIVYIVSSSEEQNYREAGRMWMALMAQAQDARTYFSCQQGYALTLVAQKQFREAEAIVQELFDTTGDARYLHLLGQIALDRDRLELAKTHSL